MIGRFLGVDPLAEKNNNVSGYSYVVNNPILYMDPFGLDTSSAILDALKNPLKTGQVATDATGRQSQRFVGQFGEVVINPQTGKIVSANPTSTKRAANLLKKLEQ